MLYYFRILTDCGLAITCSAPHPGKEAGSRCFTGEPPALDYVVCTTLVSVESLLCREQKIPLSRPVGSARWGRESGALSVAADSVGEGGGLL